MLLADLLVNGFVTGTFYSLMALGLTLVFGVLKVVNFAHGEFYMVGAYAYTLLALWAGVKPWAALPAALAAGALVGLLVERLLMRPLYATYVTWRLPRDEYAVIVTFGLSLFLMNLATQLIGPKAYRGPELVHVRRVDLGIALMSGHRLAAFVVGMAMLVAAVAFIRYTPWGRQVQAVAQNRFGASLAGIDTARVSQLVFALGGGLAALAGALLAPLYHAHPQVGMLPAVKSFVIVVLGGMGSVAGSVVGGMVLGILEALGGAYVSYAYQDAFGFLILILVLMLRPWGLFGERGREV